MVQRQESDAKRLEKEYDKLVKTRIYGAPLNSEFAEHRYCYCFRSAMLVAAPALVDLWKTSLKAHLDVKDGNAVDQAGQF